MILKKLSTFLEGDVVVTPGGEQPVQMGKGDLVIFPVGMSCTWEITMDVKKHYCFDWRSLLLFDYSENRHLVIQF